jgi:pimeloyl-ACP methyl ester carboxylesterase
MGLLARVVLGTFLAYVLYCLVLFLFQRVLLFPRYQIDFPANTDGHGEGLETWWLETRAGKVEAWFLPARQRGKTRRAPAVIFAHGNAELVDFWPQALRGFVAMGIGVLLVEYPGYGRSEGKPSQENITEAFVLGYDRLVRRPDVDPTRIVLFGRSLGGGIACALALERPSAALILMSTFTSVRLCAARFFVPGFLVLDPFDNLALVRQYSQPVLVIHGANDRLIPYEQGLALSRGAPHGKMVTYGCRHNDCPPDWVTFWKDVRSFLVEAGLGEG